MYLQVKPNYITMYFKMAFITRSNIFSQDQIDIDMDRERSLVKYNEKIVLTNRIFSHKLNTILKNYIRRARALVLYLQDLKWDRQVSKPNLSLAHHQHKLDGEHTNDSIKKTQYIHELPTKLRKFWLLAVCLSTNNLTIDQTGVKYE